MEKHLLVIVNDAPKLASFISAHNVYFSAIEMRKIIAVLLALATLAISASVLVVPAGNICGKTDDNRQGGPYYHQIYSATSTNGINWTVNTTMLFDHASVPGAVYFNNKLYLYYVNATDPENEKLSVGVSTDKGVTFTVHDVHIKGSNSPYPVDPNPIVDGNKIRLTYLGNFMQGETNKIVTATSSDGTNFTEDGVIFTENVYDPDLFYDDVGSQWVLFTSSGATVGLIKATASSPTTAFTKDTSFSWTAGGISSTHKIGSKYYTYYAAGMIGISVAEYSNGILSNIADGIVNFQGMAADPTVAIFGPSGYKMFFKTMVGGGQPEDQITVNFTGSTYKSVTKKPAGWFTSGQDADIMLSGIDFNNTGGPLLFNHPTGIASDGTRLLLADTWNNRVLVWNSLPTGNVTPDIVLGQENFYSNNPGRGLNQMNWPMGISTDGQRVVVADTNNDRILIWNTFPTKSGQSADLVIVGDPTIPKRWIDWPWGIWTNGIKLVVSSTASARVLIWNTFPTQNNQSADIYLSSTPGQGQIGTPRNIVSDGTHLIVGDHNANVPGATSHIGNFFWSTFPTSNDQTPTFFMSDPGCPGGAWMRGEFTQDGKLVLLGVGLYIWNTFPANNNTPPDLTVGQWWPGGTKYWFRPAEGAGLALAAGRLYTLSNNVIVCFNSLPTTEDAHPNFAVGGPDVYTNTLETNYFIGNPVPATDGTSLFVSSDSGKLYVWKYLPDESGAKPDIVYHLPFAPWDSALFENTLVLAGKDTVYIWNNLPLNGEMPDLRFVGGIGNVTFQDLRGVALDNQYFYLGDRSANKIYVWERIPNNNTTNAKFSIDISVPTRLSSDGTYLVAAATEAASSSERVKFYRIDELPSTQPILLTGIPINLPEAALAADGHLFIADTCFHRVLVWKNISDAVNGSPPEIVLGEEDFSDTTPEIGIDKLFWPAGLTFDGSYLWVGEFKFSGRVVRFPVKPIPHEPIYIDGNDDFVIGQNGVVSGNGTENSPYIIEGWDINTSNANGIHIENADVYFIIRNCKIHNNSDGGIHFYMVENSTVSNNHISDNVYGVFINSSHNNCFDGNIIKNSTNGDGFSMDNSNHNILVNNTIESNKYTGIGLWGSSNNLIYHNNLIGNSPNGYDDTGDNLWDNGTEGNYWSDYDEPGEGAYDNNTDGIVDTPYAIPGGSNADNYPFIEENGWIPNQPPVADFTYSPGDPMVNETITFDASNSTDPDGYITNYDWDFGDGNITNTTEPIVTYFYSSAGNYEVDLTVTDDDGATNLTSKVVSVEVEFDETEGDWLKESGIRIEDGSVPYVLRLDNGSYRLYYNNPEGIFSAISEDGLNFVKENGTRLKGTNIPGDPEWQAHGATVIKLDNGSYRMYYIGATGEGGPGHAIHRIFSAISPDGLNFIREGVRIESSGTIDNGWASVPEIVRTFDGRYRLYYCSMGATSIASAISNDGLNFIREYGPGIGNGTGVYGADPAVCKLSNGTYRMFFTSPGGPMPPWYLEKGIYSAWSEDGVNFTLESGVRVLPGGIYDSQNVFDPAVIQLTNGSFRMYYGGASEQGVVTLSAISPKIEEYQPTAVLLYSPTNITSNSITLTWSQNTDPYFANYTLYQSTTSGVLGNVIKVITNNTTMSWTVTDLSPSRTYYFTVRVYNTYGLYNDSNQVSDTTLAITATEVIGPSGGTVECGNANIVIPAGAVAKNVTINITTVPLTPPTGFEFLGAVYQINATITTFAKPINITISYNDSDIPTGVLESDLSIYKKTNSEWIKLNSTVDVVGNTVTAQVSSLSYFTIMYQRPVVIVKPTTVILNTPTGADITRTSIKLTWSQNTDTNFVNYTIYKSTISGAIGEAIKVITIQTETSFAVTGLTPNTTYYFIVRVYNTAGQYNDSMQVSATTLAEAPVEAKPSEIPWLYIIIAVVSVIILAAAGIGSKRRKKAQPPEKNA